MQPIGATYTLGHTKLICSLPSQVGCLYQKHILKEINPIILQSLLTSLFLFQNRLRISLIEFKIFVDVGLGKNTFF